MPYSTVTAGTTITASWGNANVRDQVVTPFATSAARASAITTPVEGMVSYLSDTNDLNVYNGSAWVGWLVPSGNTVATSQTTTSTTYADLGTVGPTVTVTTGTRVVVVLTASMNCNSANNPAIMGFAVSGATTRAAVDAQSCSVTETNFFHQSGVFLVTGLTAGSNIFTAKYRVGAGTGTYVDRDIIVFPLP